MQYHAKKSDASAAAKPAKAANESDAIELSAVLVTAEEGGYVSYNPETGTASQGDTEEEAFANICEATEGHLEVSLLLENKSFAKFQTIKLSTTGETEGLELSAVVSPAKDGGYTAINLEIGEDAQGKTEAEALANLRKELESHIKKWPLPKNFKPRTIRKTMKVSVHAE